MKRKETKLTPIAIIFICTTVLAIATVGFLVYKWDQALGESWSNYVQLQDEKQKVIVKDIDIKTLNEQIQDLNIRVAELQTSESALELNQQYLQNSLSYAQQNLDQQQSTIASQRQQIGQITAEANAALDKILRLQDWVSENAYVPTAMFTELANYQDANNRLYTPEGYIDTFGLGQIMYKSGLYYSDDARTTYGLSGDALAKLYDFWNGKKGDCDDFALFYTAALRDMFLWAQPDVKLKLTSVSGSHIISKSDYPYPYMICGQLIDGGGHCETILSEDELTIKHNLQSKLLIEPQGGIYQGTVEDKFSDIWWIIDSDTIYFVNEFIIYDSLDGLSSNLQMSVARN